MPDTGRVTNHLANERTFLAWIRTSISVMSLGFVIAKFSLWLHEFGTRGEPRVRLPATGYSLPLGVGMMAFGCLLAIAALIHYRSVKHAIETGESVTDFRLISGVAIFVVALGGAMIAYMLSTT